MKKLSCLKTVLCLGVFLSLTTWACSVPECSAEEAEDGRCPEPAAGEGAPCSTYDECGIGLSCWEDPQVKGLHTCQYLLRPPLFGDAGVADGDAGD